MIEKRTVSQYIFIGFFILVLVGLIVANLLGKSQDKVFAKNEALYNEMVVQLQEGQYDLILDNAASLENDQDDSEVVNYIIGLAEANIGQFSKGVQHFQRALDINPHNVEDPMFMLQYAEILIKANMLKEADIILEHCEMFAAPEGFPQYHEHIIQLQDQINGQL